MTEREETRTASSPERAKRLASELRGLGALARRLLVTERLLLVAAALAGAALALTLLDFALRFPTWLRGAHWIAGAGALVVAWVRFVWPALRLKPAATTVALRIERRRPELKGLLASGVEFAEQRHPESEGAEADLERRLAALVARRAGESWKPGAAKGLLRADRVWRAVGAAAIAAAVIAGAGAMAPSLAWTGAKRTFAPWLDAAWPKRTVVVDVTGIDVHPLGVSAPLRAALLRSNRADSATDVSVVYRVIEDGEPGGAERALLTWQSREVDASAEAVQARREAGVAGLDERGALFERLVEVSGEALEYRFETWDDRTPWRRIELTPPPAVTGATAEVTPPPYAAALPAQDVSTGFVEQTTLSMGDGTDERAVAPPFLAASELSLDLRLNKPVPAEPDNPIWLSQTFGEDAAAQDVALTVDPDDARHWRLSWTLRESTRLRITLEDQHGIISTDEAVYRFEAVRDGPPTATIAEPASDRSVLATAVVDILGEGRDDVGLEALTLERRIAAPAGGPGREPSGPGGAVEATEAAVEFAHLDAEGRTTARLEASVDLGPLGLTPGDELWLQAVATDIYAVAGETHAPVRSMPRRLRIITEEQFVEDIRGELGAVREGAIRLHEEQEAVRERLRQRPDGESLRRAQSEITEGIARQTERVEEIQRRVEQNGLNDPQLSELLEDVGRLARRAGDWSARASERLAEATAPEADAEPDEDGEAPGEEIDEAEAQDVEDAQRSVQDELTQLAEALDTGEDAWVMRRRLEDLLQRQQALREATGQAGAQTAGKPVEELTEQERSALEEIVEQQMELAQEAQDATEELSERAEQLEEHDPTAAAGMSQAARRARESQVAEQMEQAGQQAGQNQMSAAGQSQEQAIEDLEQMLEDMEEAEQAREEELRRMLTSLIESIEALIDQQQGALAAFGEAAAQERDGRFDGLDRGMIRLNRNTLGVLDQANGAGRELAPVANLIGRASEAQTQAIDGLRAEAVDAEAVRRQEERSLDLLRQAKEEAERIEQELQQQMQRRQRAELRQAYREQLEKQVALREATDELAQQGDLDRRDRATSRRLGREQMEINEALRNLVEETEELTDARIFDFAHQRLDDTTSGAGDALRQGDPGSALPDQETSISILQGLVEALRETRGQEDEFSQGGGGGGAGAGSGQPPELIPPLAELRLLRQIQIDVARRTRAAQEGDAAQGRIERLGAEQRELGELGQDLIQRMQEQQQQQQPPIGGPE